MHILFSKPSYQFNDEIDKSHCKSNTFERNSLFDVFQNFFFVYHK